MKKNDYLLFFNDCLKDNFTIKKYLPFKEQIIKIFKYHYKNNDLQFLMKTIAKELIIEYVQHLLGVYRRIINEDKIENLDEYVDLLLSIDISYHIFPQALSVLVFKNMRSDNTEYYWYLTFIYRICEGVLNNKNKIVNDDSNTRIISIMKTFLKYFQKEDMKNINGNKRGSLEVSIGMIAEFYLTDLDVSYLDNFLDNIVNDYDNTIAYLELNGFKIDWLDNYCKVNKARDVFEVYSDQKVMIK